MLGDGKWNSGDQGSFFKYQYGVLKLLESINAGIAGLPGIDYELIYTSYKANAPGAGPCAGLYFTGDFIQRVDIINAATGVITSTVWYDETLGTVLSPGCIPPIGTLDPYIPPSNITVNNPFNLEATQLLVLAALVSIDADIDVPLSTRASTADIVALSAAIVAALGPKATSADIAAVVAALGPKATSADIASVVAALAPKATSADIATIVAALGPLATEATLSAINAKIANNYGAAAGAVRTASQIGNAAGIADFGAGVTTAQTLRTVLVTDQTVIPVSLPSGAQVITSTNVVANGSVAAGATAVSFRTSAAYTGTINGLTRLLSNQYVFEAAQGKTLPAIAYTITAGSIDIDTIV